MSAFLSERIRSLWEVSGVCMDNVDDEESDVEVTPRKRREKKFNIFKSPLGNYFVFDNVRNVRNIPNLIRIEFAASGSQSSNELSDLENLEHLANSFFSLKSWIMNEDAKQKTANTLREENAEFDKHHPHHHHQSPATPPERRSYSAVLQGLCPNKGAMTPLESAPDLKPNQYSKLAPLPFPCAPVAPPTGIPCDSQTCQLEQSVSSKPSCSSKGFEYAKAQPSPCPSTQYSGRVYSAASTTESWPKTQSSTDSTNNNNSNNTCVHNTNVQMGNYSSYTLTYCPYVNTLSNNFGTVQYCNSLYKTYANNNNCAMSSYSNSCCGNYYVNNRNVNQVPRQSFAPNNPLHISPPLLLLHQQRTQAYYSNCIPQPLVYLPQSSAARSSQRWAPFLKPTSPLSYHVPVNPPPPPPTAAPHHWTAQIPTQSQYRNNNALHYEKVRVKSAAKKMVHPQVSLLQCRTEKKEDGERKSRHSSCSSISLSTSEENLIVKASASSPSLGTADKQQGSAHRLYVSEPDAHPLTSSVSVDLERQAMEQYRSSNENFYRQLRLAASEHQDQQPGNWTGPPNDSSFFGGRSSGRLSSVVARNLQGLVFRAQMCDFWANCCYKLAFL